MSKFDFSTYQEFFDTKMYEILFVKLEENLESLPDKIQKEIYANSFLNHIFSKEFIKKTQKDKVAKYFYPVVFKSLNEAEQLSFFKDRLGRIVPEELSGEFYSTLLLNGQTEEADLLLPFISKNAEDHFPMFVELIAKGKDKVFCDVLTQMNNIHFGNHVLLQLALDSNPSTVNHLVNKYKFDVNAVPDMENWGEHSYSLVHAAILEESHGHLKNLLNYHLEKINFSPVAIDGIKGRIDLVTFVLSQEPSYEQLKMFLAADLSPRITPEHIKDFLEYMMTDENILKFGATDIFEDVFAHPNFKSDVCAPSQNYFYYEMVVKLSRESKLGEEESNDEKMRALLKVFSAYLHNAKPEDMPNATSYNPLGGIVWRAAVPSRHDAEMRDAVLMVAKKFPTLINAVNPNGKTALDLSPPGSSLHTMIKEMGGKSAPSGLKKWFGGDNSAVISIPDTIKPETFIEIKQRSSFAAGASIAELLVYLKEDQDKMWKEFKQKLPDVHPEMKINYDELFTKGVEFLEFAKSHPNIVVNSYEDINFITNNMIKYLKDILDNYESVVSVANRLSNVEQRMSREQMVREGCVSQISQMSRQLTVSTEKAYQMATDEALEKMNINSRRVAGKVQNMNLNETMVNTQMRIQAKAKIQSAQNDLDLIDAEEAAAQNASVQLFNEIAQEQDKPRKTMSFKR